MNISQKLDEVEQVANAATEGPWEARVDDLTDDVNVFHDQEHVSHIAHIGPVSEPRALADATFIADARTTVPTLVAALRAVLAVHAEHVAPLVRAGRDLRACMCTACVMARAIETALGGAA